MADIDLVIKIPKELYETYKGRPPMLGDAGMDMIAQAIVNGTPLPKRHGKLKDFDKIEWYGCDLEGIGCIEAKGDCSACNHANCFAEQVRKLPTIIEADRSEE